MKRILIVCAALFAFTACGDSGSKEADKKDDKKSSEASVSDNPDYKAGLALIQNSDCFTCHKVDDPLNGPPYREIANKYASQAPDIIPKLAEKVMKGGSGVWGQVPMIAHPGLSQADAETMVKYVLLLKK